MAEIEQREIEDTAFVQHAELRIPIEKLKINIAAATDKRAAVANALAMIAEVKRVAFEHFDIDDDNADYTSFEYKRLDGDVLVIEVAQVNV